MEFETVIGLEVHAQLLTRSKIFCSCSTSFGAPANSNTCPVCLGFPGALPVLNREAVIMAVKAALALECRVNPVSLFARKNYFYPDLPKGYQISQFDQPLAEHGRLVLTGGGAAKTVRIKRIHMEEDAGKSIHDGFSDSSRYSYIDLNRAGTPLAEIVTEPDLHQPSEAYEYLSRLKMILEYLEVCDGNMEEGSLRCDANVSIRPRGETRLGTKIELKNLNSFRFVQKALEHEIARQILFVKSGGTLVQETRLWNADEQRTCSMRSKEEAHDYRYFPEPDLVPIEPSADWLADIKNTSGELPEAKRDRFINECKLPEADAEVLLATPALTTYFEECLKLYDHPKTIANWLMGDLTAYLKSNNLSIEQVGLTPAQLVEMLQMIDKGTISGKIAKTILVEALKTGKTIKDIVAEQGLTQISDESEILKIIAEVIEKNPKQVNEFKSGKDAVVMFLVGQVMKLSKGRAKPDAVQKLLREQLR